MKTPSLYSLLILVALLAGCGQSPKTSAAQRTNSSGAFMLTNTVGTVYWGCLHDSKTNDIQFIVLLPGSDQFGQGFEQRGPDYYDYLNLKTTRDGHQWKLDADVSLKSGTESLRLSDVTANMVTNIDLRKSRMWQISDDRTLTPLDKIDPLITKRISQQIETGMIPNSEAQSSAAAN